MTEEELIKEGMLALEGEDMPEPDNDTIVENIWECIAEKYGDLSSLKGVIDDLILEGGMASVEDYVENQLYVVVTYGQSEVLLDIQEDNTATGSRGNDYIWDEDNEWIVSKEPIDQYDSYRDANL